jgi:hypothetical protein
MQVWSTVPGCSLRVANGGFTSECLTSEVGTISFNSECFPLSPGSGVLAFGGLDWNPAITKVVNGVLFKRATIGRVAINPNAGVTEPCSLREVVTHEMGHALGLHHSWDPTFEGGASTSDLEATMYFIAHFDGRCASLRPDDQNGIRFIYPGQGGGDGSITITNGAMPVAVLNQPYNQRLEALGGAPPYRWGLTPGSGSLPPGLNVGADGTLSGVPATLGSFSFTVRVTDSGSKTADKDFSITVLSSSSPLNSQVVSHSAPNTVNAGHSFNVNIVWKNMGTEIWSHDAGVRLASQNPPNNTTWGGDRVFMPRQAFVGPGNSLNITFSVFAPARLGVFDLQFQLFKEGAGFFGEPSPNVRVTVIPADRLTVDGPSSIEATVGAPVAIQLSAVGGVTPYNWSVVEGGLPDGLSLNAATGSVSGVPTSPGSFTATIRASDTGARFGEKTLAFEIRPPPVQITTGSLPIAVRGSAYNQQLDANGGTPPYVWSLAGGALPGGLILNQATGVISGSPSATGSFDLTVRATDQTGGAADRPLSIRVIAPEEVPEINRVKYKAGKRKLIVNGRFMPGASLFIDDIQVIPKSSDIASFVVKQFNLTPGPHTARVLNPNGVASASIVFSVQ